MSLLQYHALWVAMALAGIAVASAALARRWRVREFRRLHAEEALEALARYSEWVAAQRRGAGFEGDRPPAASALVQLTRLQQAAFPGFAAELVALQEVHARMLDFLWRQEALRARDPEAWLESDHDQRFMALWRSHRDAVHGLADRLRGVAQGLPLADPEPESVFPA